VREALRLILEAEGLRVEAYASAKEMLDAFDPCRLGCVILDLDMPGMDGLSLQQALLARGAELPIIFLSAKGDIPKVVEAMKQGAVDFLEKPATGDEILQRIDAAIGEEAKHRSMAQRALAVQRRYEHLTERECEVMALVAAGLSNKHVARKLGISVRTAEGHRLRIMEKMQADSLGELVEMARGIGVALGPETPDG